jgi:hypothetical protein
MRNKINRALELLRAQELEAGLGLENGQNHGLRADDLGYHLDWLMETNADETMFKKLYDEIISSLNTENLQKMGA